jgi:hypothetical protein
MADSALTFDWHRGFDASLDSADELALEMAAEGVILIVGHLHASIVSSPGD